MESLRVFWGELGAFRYGVILLFVLTLPISITLFVGV